MSRHVGSLHRSISHPANLQNPIPIIPLFAFLPPESPHIHPNHPNSSSGMDFDANSDITVFNTISQFNNSDIEIPDKFANSEPSLSTFSHPPPPSTHSLPIQNDSPSTLSHIFLTTTTYSPFTNECSNNNSRKPHKSHMN